MPRKQQVEFLALPPVPDTTLTKVDLVFPASVRHLMPRREDIPTDYPRRGEWKKFQATWFYQGLDPARVKAKPGVDLTKALAHLTCIQRSFEPKHEDKVDAVSWLAPQWLDESSLEVVS